MTTETFAQLVDLIELAIIVIAFIAVYKSVPADKVAELRQKAGRAADQTETPLDNLLLQFYDFLEVTFGSIESLRESAKLMHAIPEVTPEESPFVHPADEHRG